MDRLMDAVDAIFEAQKELGTIVFPLLPSRLLGHSNQPYALCDFSRMEIVEGEKFLYRCGLLELRPSDRT